MHFGSMFWKSMIAVSTVFVPALAFATGFERIAPSVDRLFTPGNSLSFSGTYLSVSRPVTAVNAVDLTGTPVTTGRRTDDPVDNDFLFNFEVKMAFSETVDCMFGINEPYKVWNEFSPDWRGRFKTIVFNINTKQYRTACSFAFPAGNDARIRLIGGLGIMTGDAVRTNNVAAAVLGTATDGYSLIDFPDTNNALTWQVGVSYEIPARAARAMLLFTSGADLQYDGRQIITGDNTILLDRRIRAVIPYPESVELKLQSAVAPGWLVSGSLKWQNWSEFGDIPVVYSDTTVQFADYSPRLKDGWTATMGVGHVFNEKLAGEAFLRWDSSTNTGWDLTEEAWTIGAGVKYDVNDSVALTFGAGLTWLTSGAGRTTAPEIQATAGDDFLYLVQTGVEFKF